MFSEDWTDIGDDPTLLLTDGVSDTLPRPRQETTESPTGNEAARNHHELGFEMAELQRVVRNLFL